MKTLLIILTATILIFTACKSEDSQSAESQSPPNPPVSDSTDDAPPPAIDPTDDTRPNPPPADPSSDIGPPTTPPPFTADPAPEPDPTPTPDIEPPIELEPEPIIPDVRLALLTDATNDKLYFYNGVEFSDQSADNPKYCGYRCFTDGTTLNYYDSTGDVYASHDLIIAPDLISRDSTTGTTYIVENIDPATALSLGAQHKDYARIYIDNVEQQWWFFNQYIVKDLFSIGSDVFTKDSNGKFRDINENLTGINAANGLIVWDFDSPSKTAIVRTPDGVDHSVSWAMNNFNNSKYWQFLDGIWYSQNGYEFDGATLTENVNPLWTWNGEVILGAGTDEAALYWIDASTGWLYRHIVSIDSLEQRWRLYNGDGLTSTGYAKIDNLKPVLIRENLYFSDGGAVWKMDVDTGLVGVFFGGDGVVREF